MDKDRTLGRKAKNQQVVLGVNATIKKIKTIMETDNIQKAINILQNQKIDNLHLQTNPPYLIVPKSHRVVSDRYRKIGRPRREDYDYVDWVETFLTP